MGYINSELLPKENLILKAKIYGVIYVSALIILGIGLLLCFRGGGSGIEVIGFILTVIKLFKAWLYGYSTELTHFNAHYCQIWLYSQKHHRTKTWQNGKS